MLDAVTKVAGKFVFASLLPIAVLVGAIYFVVDAALRGIEQSVGVTNERIGEIVYSLDGVTCSPEKSSV